MADPAEGRIGRYAATLREHLKREFGDASDELVETVVRAKIESHKIEMIDGIVGTLQMRELEQFLDEFKALGKAASEAG